ncbi:MAG TPA: hypothetical protein VF855_12070 [Acidimicrobiales bacterium]
MNPPTTTVICTTCWRLRTSGGHTDHCHCSYPRRKKSPGEAEGLLACDLCYVCGLGVTRGHSRWRSLLCDHCRPLVRAFNSKHRKLVLPLGIHSVVNGVAYSANPKAPPAATLAELTTFTDDLVACFGLVRAASEYGEKLVRDRCEGLGLAGNGDIPLGGYLVRAAVAGETAAGSWWRLRRKLEGDEADGRA